MNFWTGAFLFFKDFLSFFFRHVWSHWPISIEVFPLFFNIFYQLFHALSIKIELSQRIVFLDHFLQNPFYYNFAFFILISIFQCLMFLARPLPANDYLDTILPLISYISWESYFECLSPCFRFRKISCFPDFDFKRARWSFRHPDRLLYLFLQS